MLAGLALAVLLGCTKEKAMDANFPVVKKEDLVQQAWQKIEQTLPPAKLSDLSGPPRGVVWNYVISPPFPAAWPPDGKGMVYYYAYASGFRMGLVDAEVVAAPWGRLTADALAGVSPKLEMLGERLTDAGVQGVRPLEPEEISVYKTKEAVEARILALSQSKSIPPADEKLIRLYFCQWRKGNGVIAGQIGKFHPGFFKWLECK